MAKRGKKATTWLEQFDGFIDSLAPLASFRHSKTAWTRLITKFIHIIFLFSFSHFVYIIDLIHAQVNMKLRLLHLILMVFVHCLICEWDYLLNLFESNYRVMYLCIVLMEAILVIMCTMIHQTIRTKYHLNFHKIPCVVRETFPKRNGYYNILKKYRKRMTWFWFYICIMFFGKIVLNSLPGLILWIKFVFLAYLLDYLKNTIFYGLCLDSVIILFIFSSCIWNVSQQDVLGIVYLIELLQDSLIVYTSYVVFSDYLTGKDDLKQNINTWNNKTNLKDFIDFFENGQRKG
eukprot:552089_1